MKLKKKTIDEIESLGPEELMKAYEIILSLKKEKKNKD
jgi:hypothetical protein